MIEKMEGADNSRPMGRPPLGPLGLQRTNIHLPRQIGERIARLLGDRETRAAFIREAIEHEIQRREADLQAKKKPGRK
jgi:hypothetical protein